MRYDLRMEGSTKLHRYWFEAFVPQRIGQAILLAIASWVLLVGLFLWAFDYFEPLTEDNASSLGTSLFFSCMLVYTVFAGAWVLRRSAQLVREMPLTCSKELQERYAEKMLGASARRLVILLVAALVAGTIHNMLIQGSLDPTQMWSGSIALGGSIGAWLVWITITAVIMSFIVNANRFAEIGEKHIEIDLLEPERMQLLGRAALMPTFGVIGTQALYPLLWIGGVANMTAAVPGFVVTAAALTYLFIRSTMPIHRRIKMKKREELDKVRQAITEKRADSSALPSEELMSLLRYRDYVERCSEWPFRIGVLFRWLLYLLIPPLTWVGAALIENLVDAALIQ